MEIAALLAEREEALAEGQSEREFCKGVDVPRSTLRDEVGRVRRLDMAPEVATFYTSPPGQLQLMRIVLAAHFVMTLLGCCGVALVKSFLLLAGLGPFVGTSYGAQQAIHAWLQEQVVAFGQQEQKRLGKAMPVRTIWLCEDETFFPQMVLVAIEALSDYVLVERVADRRDAATWSAAVTEQLEGLTVEVAGLTADGAKGIAAHAQQSFGQDVTPDVFHVQHDVSKVVIAPLASRVRAAEEQVRRQGEDDKAAAEELDKARMQQQRMAAAIDGLGEAYRPYDERTGEIRRGKQVASDLHEMLDEAEAVATSAGLSEASHKGIGKARRAVDAIAASIEGYHQRVALCLSALHLPGEIQSAMRDQVLPALYLERIAEQSRDSETKRQRHARAQALTAPLQDEATSPMMLLSEAAVADLLRQGRSWVALHVRASSCVEGRNGQLELHHHGLRGLSETKLAALTVVHNFWTRRADGTTAAERFFEQQPRDLFEWLVDVMPELPRPARKRPHVAPSPLLN
ncbi:MAG: DUF6399 domain-containing protein [Solirubrobacteraceae bacterium]